MATEADYARLGAWAVMYNSDKGINRRHSVRKVPMSVLSLGFPRTGTLSMQEALAMLGYSAPYHFSSIFANVQDGDLWIEAFAAKQRAKDTGKDDFNWRAHFDQLLGHSAAITDVPAICFWRELLEAYPEAKVVLVERDMDKWLASLSTLLDGALNPFGRYVLRFTNPAFNGRMTKLTLCWTWDLLGTTDRLLAKERAREAYLKHYTEIKESVPRERLLEYRLGSGWEPLCNFLGKEIPDEDFPFRNEAKTVEAAIDAFIKKSLKASLWNVSVVVVIVAAIGKFLLPKIRDI